MSHGRDAARDLRYGRRGGRWAPDTRTPCTCPAHVVRHHPLGCPTCGGIVTPDPIDRRILNHLERHP